MQFRGVRVRGRFLCALLIILSGSSLLAGQIITGTIQGLVTDQSGAVLPGVTIAVKNLDTNQVRTTVTNETGNYIAPLLAAGRYEVSAELPGFRTDVRSGLELRVEQRLNLNFVLEIGEITERLVVTETAPLVQSDTATVGTTIDAKTIVELPLAGRRFSSIGVLIPTATRMRSEASDGSEQRDMFSVVGLPARYNNYMLDGIENNDNAISIAAIKPSMDSVMEYKILTGTYSAEYGRGGGAQVNVITKSGGNQFHGSIYEFYRNSGMDARNYFAKPDAATPPLSRHQFGFALGGPIVPDKTFFFIADEGLRLRQSLSRATLVPTPEMKRGDFSALLQPNHIFGTQPIVIRDPFSNNAPFPGNIIPASRFDPSGFAIANVFPDPNQAGRINFVASPPELWKWHQPSLRIDHRFSQNDNLWFRWNHNLLRTVETFRGSSLPGYAYMSRMHGNNVGLAETHVFTPNLINEVRLGYGFFFEQYPSQNRGYDAAEQRFGIHGTSRDPREMGYPRFQLQGFSAVGDGDPAPRIDHTYQIYDAMSWVEGNHALKFGVEGKRVQNALYLLGNARGTFVFNGRYTGHSVADALLGLPTQTSISRGERSVYIRSRSLYLFAQDDWKFSRRLTLNLGLRYEVTTSPYEKDNKRSNFNPATGKVEYAGVDGVPRGLSPTDWNNLAPRVGFAYNLTSDGRTVVRAGYGVYFNQVSRASMMTGSRRSYPWVEDLNYVASTTRPDITMRDPFPASLGTTVIQHFAQDPNLRTPYIQQYTFGVQREFGGNLVVEVNYIGNRATKQNIERHINQPTPGPGDRNAVNARRPFPNQPNITQIQTSSNMNYNAMTVRAEKRFSAGLTFNTSYTWGKAIHDQSSPDMRNNRQGRGPADIDNRNRVVSSFLYELPFGSGKRFGSGVGGVMSKIIRGWQMAGVLQLRSGQAFTPTLSADVSNTTVRSDRPNVIGDTRSSNPGPRTGWWNRDALTMPAPFTFGNAGAGILVGPDLKNLDFSIQKVTQVGESKNLEFRAEFFNIANHPNFASPNSQFDSPLFGTISAALDARQIQLGLKFIF